MFKNLFFIFASVVISLSFVQAAFAQGLREEYRPTNLPTLRGITAETSAETQARFFIGDIITVILAIVGIIAVWEIVTNAFYIVLAFGQSEKIEQRKKTLYWAVGALLLIILSYIIFQFLVQFIIGVAEEPGFSQQTPGPATDAPPD